MLLLAPQSYDGSLAVALRLKRRQGGKREPGDQFTNGGAGGNELTEIALIATDQRILYHRDCCDLSERYIGRLHGFRAPLVDEYERLRSEEHTSELQSLMRISYAVFCLKKKK